MIILAICSFLNEERLLGEFLRSIAAQTRLPDRLLLVDDGSVDRSQEIAAEFAARHPFATVLARPVRPAERDRLASAPELVAFQWALERWGGGYDIVAKLDGDIRLTPSVFAEMERRFSQDPTLGMAGPYLRAPSPDGRMRREPCPPYHVRGPARFYRRACYEQIAPLPATLGWDTIDEVSARMSGWRTASFEVPGGDPVHLRATGAHDGLLRSWRRLGWGTYAYGAHPLHVVLAALSRVGERPPVLGSCNYLMGWVSAWARRVPRADAGVRAHVRREQLGRIRSRLRLA